MGLTNFSCKGPGNRYVINILDSEAHMVSIVTTQRCRCSREAAISNRSVNVLGRVPIKLYVQRQEVGRIPSGGHCLLTFDEDSSREAQCSVSPLLFCCLDEVQRSCVTGPVARAGEWQGQQPGFRSLCADCLLQQGPSEGLASGVGQGERERGCRGIVLVGLPPLHFQKDQ